MVCASSARFNMTAELVKSVITDDAGDHYMDEPNEWVVMQHPDSGELIRKYVPLSEQPGPIVIADKVVAATFKCMARSIVSDGIRVTGTTERFGGIYENEDYVKIWFPADVELSKRDQITNIKGPDGEVIWVEEETPGRPPTVFNVLGVTPQPNPFGKVLEKMALLERADQQ